MVALTLYARNELTRTGLSHAAGRAGLSVVRLTEEPSSLVAACRPDVVFRAPGGLVAQAMALGAKIRLAGPTPGWFVELGEDVTGRKWSLVNPAGARAGLYGCDPHEALTAILAANAADAAGPGDRWLWKQDPALPTP